MDIKETFAKEILILQKKFPKMSDLIESAIEDAIVIYRNRRRDFDQEIFNSNEKNWIKRCSEELLATDDYKGFSSYSENGFSVSVYETRISPMLMNEILPKVGVPRRRNTDDSQA